MIGCGASHGLGPTSIGCARQLAHIHTTRATLACRAWRKVLWMRMRGKKVPPTLRGRNAGLVRVPSHRRTRATDTAACYTPSCMAGPRGNHSFCQILSRAWWPMGGGLDVFKRRSGVSQLSRLSQHQKASQLAWRSAQLCFSLRSRSAPADFAVHRRRLLDLLALADAARFRSRAALTNLPALILLCHALLIALSCTRSHTSSPPLLEAELTAVSGANVHPLAASAAELKPAAHSNRSLASLHRRSCCLACWLRPLPACRMKLLLCRRLPCPRTLVGPAALPASDRWRRCVHQLSFHPNGWRPHHQR